MGQVFKLKNFHPMMVPELPGCPEPLIDQRLKHAIRRYCIDTEAWKVTIDPVDLVASQQEYSVTPNWDARIQRVAEVRVNSEAGVTNGDEGNVIHPTHYEFTAPKTLRFESSYIPSDSVTDGLVVDAILVPFIDEFEIDEEFLNRWYEPIMAWAMHDLMMMAAKKWTNPVLAAQNLDQYNLFLNKDIVEKEKKGTTRSRGFRF